MITGTVSFQSNDAMDIFHVAIVQEEGVEVSPETLLHVEDAQFDGDKAWVTGYVPKLKSVCIEGDTATITAWYRGESFDKSFKLTIYLECEMVEELVAVTDEEPEQKKAGNDWMEPREIHL